MQHDAGAVDHPAQRRPRRRCDLCGDGVGPRAARSPARRGLTRAPRRRCVERRRRPRRAGRARGARARRRSPTASSRSAAPAVGRSSRWTGRRSCGWRLGSIAQTRRCGRRHFFRRRIARDRLRNRERATNVRRFAEQVSKAASGQEIVAWRKRLGHAQNDGSLGWRVLRLWRRRPRSAWRGNRRRRSLRRGRRSTAARVARRIGLSSGVGATRGIQRAARLVELCRPLHARDGDLRRIGALQTNERGLQRESRVDRFVELYAKRDAVHRRDRLEDRRHGVAFDRVELDGADVRRRPSRSSCPTSRCGRECGCCSGRSAPERDRYPTAADPPRIARTCPTPRCR